ncbi:MAG: hypothetical protein US25_C0014G0004 [Candidatus Moranbacteria bacterium GW2011_GWE1_36_7]|nr:MAG: hypothetical protein UR99_C0026G0004 [Candidatus Moranbacteria bacterium GW2011_GWD2_36_12]KKQ06514.1 MAG: hypothetical protein US16_C0015G0011 [Candidatus Moranbacteria bacterium GW2011_GWE2_36_40]KKQ15076.1 MAG: hypothetical protein US25_C0014G0004 [Candidatus Moranbacteria bacterium GW2011_GWE1_36_7]
MKITKELIGKIEKEAREFFQDASGCHDWSHVERVRKMALHVGKLEKANVQVLEIASLLHDIGRRDEMKSKGLFCHAEKGAELAIEILDRYCIENEMKKEIIHCIFTHRNRTTKKPESLEAKILFDADKLDSSGAVSVARDFLFAGNAGSNCLYTGNEKKLAKSKINYSYTKEDSAILEYEINLKYIKDRMLTNTGKNIAKERHKFMKDFFERFWEEVGGKK